MGNLQIYKLVQEVYNKLPENQKQVADYIMHNTEKVMFMNVQELAKKTNVSVASVVRFSQRVGFKGFTELRTKLTDDFQNQIASKSIFPLIDNLKEDTLTSVANIEIKNINETINLVDRKGFNKAADIINKSKLVFCAGLGVSNILATLMSYQLSLIGVQSSSFIKGPLTFLEQAINSKENFDLILEPESFGKVRVNVSLESLQLDVKLTAENSATLAILRASESVLQSITELNGLKLAEYNVELSNNNQNNSGSKDQKENSGEKDVKMSDNRDDLDEQSGSSNNDSSHSLNLIA